MTNKKVSRRGKSPKNIKKSKSPKKYQQKGGSRTTLTHTNKVDLRDIRQFLAKSDTQGTEKIEIIDSSSSSSNNFNIMTLFVVILLGIIGYLIYLNVQKSTELQESNNDLQNLANNKSKFHNILMDPEVNNALLEESEIIKKFKNNNKPKKRIIKRTRLNDPRYHPNSTITYDDGYRVVNKPSVVNNPNMVGIIDAVIDHNYERLVNPLLPPERSYVNTYGIPTNIPTRGISGGFQQVGSLHKTEVSNDDTQPGNNTKSVILPLFGQPTYPGSNKWNYYTTTDKNAMVKMTFKVGNKNSDDRHGVNELMTGDDIQIPEYNGKFDVKIYQFDQPKYIPVVY